MQNTWTCGIEKPNDIFPLLLEWLEKRDPFAYRLLVAEFKDVIESKDFESVEGRMIELPLIGALNQTTPQGFHFGARLDIEGLICYGVWPDDPKTDIQNLMSVLQRLVAELGARDV